LLWLKFRNKVLREPHHLEAKWEFVCANIENIDLGESLTMVKNDNANHVTRWKLDDLVEIVDEFDERMCDYINYAKIRFMHDYKNTLIFMSGKCIVTMKEIICLVQCGYPDGALVLARNMYEQFILARFFEKHKVENDFQNYVEDFWLDYEIKQVKFLRIEAERIRKNDEEKMRLSEKISQLQLKAHRHEKNKKNSEYWWAGHRTFKDIVDEVNKEPMSEEWDTFVNILHLMYKRACIATHASCPGNAIRLGNDSQFCGVDNSPHDKGHSISLLMATYAFSYILQVTSLELSIKSVELEHGLLDLLEYYNSLLEADY